MMNWVKWSALFLLAIMITLFCYPCVSFADGSPKTPEEAMSEMSWGVNLGNLYMADKVYGESGKEIGYCYYAPIGIAAWFWDDSFDWIVNYKLHDREFSASVSIPSYSDPSDDYWFDGMFKLGIFIQSYTSRTVTIQLSNTRIVKSNGSEISIPSVNGVYEVEINGEYNDYGFANCMLDIDGIPEPSVEYNGALLVMDVTLIDVPFSETGKVDYFFEYQREAVDQYEYTNAYFDQGANVFRLPVTWSSFVDDQTFVIDGEWIEAIKTEVDYIIERGGYCILNMHDDYLSTSFVGDHWEDCWMMDEYSEYVNARYRAVWDQIADSFRDYPDTLIFESANEPTMTWDPARMTSMEFAEMQTRRTNELNSIFVDAVRESGGNNETRILCLAVANYDSVQQLNTLEIPEDDYIIATLHSYQEMEDNAPNSGYDPNFNYEEKTDAFFATVSGFTTRTGVPVLIGEVGATYRIPKNVRDERIAYYFQKCIENCTPALWWEDFFITEDGYYYWMYDIENRCFPEEASLLAIQQAYNTVPGDPLLAAQFVMEQESVMQGDRLNVRITSSDPDVQWFDAYVVASDNRSYYHDYVLNGSDLSFNTQNMIPGEYKFVLISGSEGRMPSYATSQFFVTESPLYFEYDGAYFEWECMLGSLGTFGDEGWYTLPRLFTWMIDNEEQLVEAFGTEPDVEWRAEWKEGFDPGLSVHAFRAGLVNDDCCAVSVNALPDEPTTTIFHLECSWAGHFACMPVRITYIALPDNLPAGSSFPYRLTLPVNETVVITGSFPEGEYDVGANFADIDIEAGESILIQRVDDFTLSFTGLVPGQFEGMTIVGGYGQGYYQKPISVTVTDKVIVLPQKAEQIDTQAFFGIKDVVVSLPASVSIADDAFDPSVTVICPSGSTTYDRCVELGLCVIGK